ncbi:MAG TPA: VOC family protein [Acidobacteriaceae bacterium]
MELDHIALYVYDLPKSAAFYEKILGLQQIPEPFHDNLHVWLRIGPHLALHLVGGAASITEHPISRHNAFHVASLEPLMAQLDRSHVPYRNLNGDGKINIRPDGIRQIYLQDPDGYWIEVNEEKH